MASKKTLMLLAVGGLALAGYAAAASTGALPDGVDMGLGANAKCDRGAENADPAAVEQRVQMCERHGRALGMPAFREDNGTVEGRWLSFTVDAATGELRDVTSKGPMADALLFQRIQLGSALGGQAQRGHWMATAGGLKLAALDAPNALLGIVNKGNHTATVTFTAADGFALRALPDAVSGPNATGVVLTKDTHSAALNLLRGATDSVDGQVVTVTLPKDAAVVFHIRGFPGLLSHELRGMHHGMPEGRGGEGRHGMRHAPPPGMEPPSDAAGDAAGDDFAGA